MREGIIGTYRGNIHMDHETSPFRYTKMPKAKPNCKLMDISLRSNL